MCVCVPLYALIAVSLGVTDKIMPVGRLHINGSSQVIQLNPPLDSFSRVSPSLADLDSDSDDDVEAGSCFMFMPCQLC